MFKVYPPLNMNRLPRRLAHTHFKKRKWNCSVPAFICFLPDGKDLISSKVILHEFKDDRKIHKILRKCKGSGFHHYLMLFHIQHYLMYLKKKN